MKRYSVAQARASLTALLAAVGEGDVVEITRRGKPVARVLRAEGGGIGKAIGEWRKSAPRDAFVTEDWADSLRDRGPGRKIHL